MKIIRLGQGAGTFQYIPPNATGDVNQDAQLQNLQNSQQALNFLQTIVSASNDAMEAVRALDEALGANTGLIADVTTKVNQAITQSPAFDLLQKMGMLADVGFLQDPNKMSQLQMNIQRQVTDYSSGMAAQ